jgi:hypothetical protein
MLLKEYFMWGERERERERERKQDKLKREIEAPKS